MDYNVETTYKSYWWQSGIRLTPPGPGFTFIYQGDIEDIEGNTYDRDCYPLNYEEDSSDLSFDIVLGPWKKNDVAGIDVSHYDGEKEGKQLLVDADLGSSVGNISTSETVTFGGRVAGNYTIDGSAVGYEKEGSRQGRIDCNRMFCNVPCLDLSAKGPRNHMAMGGKKPEHVVSRSFGHSISIGSDINTSKIEEDYMYDDGLMDLSDLSAPRLREPQYTMWNCSNISARPVDLGTLPRVVEEDGTLTSGYDRYAPSTISGVPDQDPNPGYEGPLGVYHAREGSGSNRSIGIRGRPGSICDVLTYPPTAEASAKFSTYNNTALTRRPQTDISQVTYPSVRTFDNNYVESDCDDVSVLASPVINCTGDITNGDITNRVNVDHEGDIEDIEGGIERGAGALILDPGVSILDENGGLEENVSESCKDKNWRLFNYQFCQLRQSPKPRNLPVIPPPMPPLNTSTRNKSDGSVRADAASISRNSSMVVDVVVHDVCRDGLNETRKCGLGVDPRPGTDKVAPLQSLLSPTYSPLPNQLPSGSPVDNHIPVPVNPSPNRLPCPAPTGHKKAFMSCLTIPDDGHKRQKSPVYRPLRRLGRNINLPQTILDTSSPIHKLSPNMRQVQRNGAISRTILTDSRLPKTPVNLSSPSGDVCQSYGMNMDVYVPAFERHPLIPTTPNYAKGAAFSPLDYSASGGAVGHHLPIHPNREVYNHQGKARGYVEDSEDLFDDNVTEGGMMEKEEAKARIREFRKSTRDRDRIEVYDDTDKENNYTSVSLHRNKETHVEGIRFGRFENASEIQMPKKQIIFQPLKIGAKMKKNKGCCSWMDLEL